MLACCVDYFRTRSVNVTKTAFCDLGSERLPVLSTICFVGCVWAFVCFALVCRNISLPFTQLLMFVLGTAVSYF